MSITPVRTASGWSKVGIASGPPTNSICTTPWPAAFTLSMNFRKLWV
jgi:hypothetical protein